MDYRSVDSVLEVDNAVQYPLELLNTLNPPGFPAHRPILKLEHQYCCYEIFVSDLCNGT